MSTAGTCRIAIVGTGGTIAGVSSADAGTQSSAYLAGVLPIDQIVQACGPFPNLTLEYHEPFRLPSEDLNESHWWQLLQTLQILVARTDIDAIVVTHGTDTLEESAFFIYLTLVTHKPVVFTGAMRPADHPQADGPQNLRQALAVAHTAVQAKHGVGVAVVFGGQVFAVPGLRKMHMNELAAFANPHRPSADVADVLSVVWPAPPFHFPLLATPSGWPLVPILSVHAGWSATLLEAWQTLPLQGLVVEGFGAGTISSALDDWLVQRTTFTHFPIARASRVPHGVVLENQSEDDTRLQTVPAGILSAVQARVLVILSLITKQDNHKLPTIFRCFSAQQWG